ncbi:MAG: ATP-dependent DNA helicase RecG [Alphaproteobacteria bacterium]|nr:ATP-dependent DNA helicase RecG [Alphaproteobacteria bacterium]MBT5389830.1 ATP-dependent DNA helicase RecG [Alphaproteobacteria bacterium]MBT5540086.1 ATP-dependent DNA helicase RecG [Alphaproteobacteria bacterium]
MPAKILAPLFSPLSSLEGIGPKTEKILENFVGSRVLDLLLHLPTKILCRYPIKQIADLGQFEEAVHQKESPCVSFVAKVHKHYVPFSKRQPYRIRCKDPSGNIDLIFFRADARYMDNILPTGEERLITGSLNFYKGKAQMTHPDHVGAPEDLASWCGAEAHYPLSTGISSKLLQKTMASAIQTTPELPEWIDRSLHKKKAWPSWQEALSKSHSPQEESALEPTSPERQRLAYDELLANQLLLRLMRQYHRKIEGKSRTKKGELIPKLLEILPFELTLGQKAAWEEISQDMAAPMKMVRLLHGDVGSGKTMVAFLALLRAVETGEQAALMAPTEILAQQHFQTLAPLAEKLGLKLDLFTGTRNRMKNAKESHEKLASGETQIAIGTHALLYDSINFKNLGLVVIDEQHRFGVDQRLSLTSKNNKVDVLAMTATPIPRTLQLTAFGDMDVSCISDKPSNRGNVTTGALSIDRLEDVIQSLERVLEKQEKVYWICPLIEESELLDLAAAKDRYESLRTQFGDKVGLVHGKMKSDEKDKVMAQFKSGDISILIATTVIEVGVHVDDATLMVIEHAERFGLSQLHQLRGRIGRSSRDANCFLLYESPLSPTAQRRLGIMRKSNDGFRIAEEDLKLRGAGDIMGSQQSGKSPFRIANLFIHQDLLQKAYKDAQLLLNKDPQLKSERGKAARILLALFEREKALKYLQSG